MGKLAPKMDGPYRILEVTGRMMQRITMVGSSGQVLHCHASKLAPFSGPVDESTWAPPKQAASGAGLAAEDNTPPPTRKRRLRRSDPNT